MFWTPPSNNQINSNTNPYRSLTTEQLRQNTQRMWQEASEKKLKDQYTWDAKTGKYVRIDGKKTKFDDLADQYTWDEKTGKYVRLDGQTGIVAESKNLSEGGVKAALEDWMYSIPKAAIEELRPVMKIKSLSKRFSMINKVLKKHGFTDQFMGSMPANVVNDYFDTFFGESAELDEVSPPGWEGTVKAMKKKKEIDNPWALAWWMKGKGYKSHRKADGTKKESVEIGEAKSADSSMVNSAVKTVMKNLHSMSKKPNSDYDKIADAIEMWSQKKTRANFDSAVKLVVPYVEDVIEELEGDSPFMFTDDQIVDVAEMVVEKHAKHMGESFDISEQSDKIKLVKEMGSKTLYQYGFEYYIVSTSSMAGETMIFKADSSGNPKSYTEVWGEKDMVDHDYAIKDFVKSKFKKDAVVESNDCGCSKTVEESHTRAELEKLSITRLRELMKEYDKKASKGDRDAARELADIRGILRSRGAGSVVEENLQERSLADLAAEIIPVKFRSPSSKPKKVTAIKLVLPDTPDMKKKMKKVLEKDNAYLRKMQNLVIDREERENGELVLHFASFRGRENFTQMMNDAAK